MSTVASAEVLRPGLLEGVSILLAHAGTKAGAGGAAPGSASLHDALTDSARATSARLTDCELPVEEESFAQQLGEDGLPDLLVVDAAGVFAAAGEPGRAALGHTMQLTWEVTRAAAGALIEQHRPGRNVLVGPPEDARSPDTRTFARGTRAGLENLARTTSIEWSRYQITTIAIAPGAGTTAQSLAGLCAYLASPAGSYFSGCVLTLDGDPGASGRGAGGITFAS